MRAVTFSRLGGPEVLEVLERPAPQPGPGEVRIRVAASTVNPTDISFRSGRQFTVAACGAGGVTAWERWRRGGARARRALMLTTGSGRLGA